MVLEIKMSQRRKRAKTMIRKTERMVKRRRKKRRKRSQTKTRKKKKSRTQNQSQNQISSRCIS